MSEQVFDHSKAVDGALMDMPLDLIDDISFGNSRSKRKPEKFQELVDSIKDEGILQNLVVRPSEEKENRYELIAGYGRREAGLVAKLKSVPVQIRHVDDTDAYKIQLSENTKREDLGVVDEIKSSVKWVSFFDGDHESAAKQLGWDVIKLRQRLKLGTAIEPVLDALDKELIAIGHVELLCQVTATTQEKTLPKIVEGKWSVNELAERMNKIRSPLRRAKFDISECKTCTFNSSFNGQNELFSENNVGKDTCTNKKCWNEKTKGWLDGEKERLEGEYGTVIFLTDKADLRNTVNAEAVGQEQFDTGCNGCKSNVVILNDMPRQEGEVILSQCVDPSCFKKCQKKLEASNTAKTSTGTKKTNTKSSKTATAKNKDSSKGVVSKTPKSVISVHRIEARADVAEGLKKQAHFVNVLMASALLEMSGKSSELLGDKSMPNDGEGIALKLFDKTENEIGEIIKSAIHCIIDESKCGAYEYDSFQKLMHQAGKHYGLVEDAFKAWKPTESNLKSYQKGGLEGLLKQAKFDKAFDKVKGVEKVESFAKLMKQPKAKLIEIILAFDFDWTDFAPKEYTDIFK